MHDIWKNAIQVLLKASIIKKKLIVWNRSTFKKFPTNKDGVLEEISGVDQEYSDNMGLP